MIARFLPTIALALLPAAAGAAERNVGVPSFERVRVAGPFEVRIVTGGPPRARIEGDEAAIDRVDVSVEGDTLAVRIGHAGWAETPGTRAAGPAIVTLSTPAIRSVVVSAGARVVADRVAGARVDLAVNGAGALSVGAVDANEMSATVIGAGAMTLGGKALRARLLTNGPGTIDAAALEASDLVVRLDGTGETRARARYTARITDTGTGRVVVLGDATCVVSAAAGGPVACGRVAGPVAGEGDR